MILTSCSSARPPFLNCTAFEALTVNRVWPSSDLEMEKPSAVCWISMPIFLWISCKALRTRQRAYRYIPATTTTIRIAPAANQRRSRETGRGMSSSLAEREQGIAEVKAPDLRLLLPAAAALEKVRRQPHSLFDSTLVAGWLRTVRRGRLD